MTIRIWIVRSVRELRECHAGFTINNLEELPAATLANSAFAFAVMDNEVFTRKDADWSAEIPYMEPANSEFGPRKPSSKAIAGARGPRSSPWLL